MAGTNDFKAFATDANANVTSQEEWETLTALKKGFSSGKASSAQVSKALRQPSTMAAVLGQFIANAELDALDDGDVDGLVAKLATAITTNLGLGEAAKLGAAVGVTGNTGRILIPALIGGVEQNIIFQWVSGFLSDSTGVATVTLPMAFPNALFHATAIDSGASASSWNGSAGTTWGFDIGGSTRTTVKVRVLRTTNGTSWAGASAAGCLFAIGY